MKTFVGVGCLSLGVLLAAAAARAGSLPDGAVVATRDDEAGRAQLVQTTEPKAPDLLSAQYSLALLSHDSPLPRPGKLPGDAAAAPGDGASGIQLVKETEQKSADFVFRQYTLPFAAVYSYLIGSGGQAMIVNPAHDVGRYLKDAQELGLKITRVYLTDSKAGSVAGYKELAKATGAELVVHEVAQSGRPHKAGKDRDTIVFGKVRVVVVTTPGHNNADGTCLYVYHPTSETNPAFVVTGATLFIGSVSRPDLMWSTTIMLPPR